MPGESITVDLNANDRASSKIRDVGRAAADTSAKLDILAASQKVFTDSSIKVGKAADTSAAALRSHVAADKLYSDAMRVASGETTKFTKLIHAMPGDLDKASASADKLGKAASAAAGTGLTGLGAMQGGGMGALVAAGAVLSPILVSLGVGAAGFAAAAYGLYKPISTAAQATGGLRANMHTLNAEQQTVAKGLLGLGKQYHTFEMAMQPSVMKAFNDGLKLAGTLMHSVEPVASAFGKSFGGFLTQVDNMFSSGEWQSFFGFMARTVGPDLKEVGGLFVNLADTLPPLVVALQPIASALVKIASGLASTGVAAEKLSGGPLTAMVNFGKAGQSIKDSSTGVSGFNAALDVLVGPKLTHSADNFFHSLAQGFDILDGHQKGALKPTRDVAEALGHYTTVAYQATFQTGKLGRETDTVSGKAKIFAGITAQDVVNSLKDEAKQLNRVAAGYENSLGPLGNYIDAQITERNDLATLNQNLKKSHDAIGLKTQAERNSYQSAQQYIGDTIKQGNAALAAHKGIDAQITSIQHALPELESVKGKTANYKQELDLLKGVLDALKKERLIQEQVRVSGTGTWQLNRIGAGPLSSKPLAAGGMVYGGIAGRDSVPIMAMPGEVVVPTPMVKAGAVDHLRGALPGFASGGIVGSYNGPVAGLPPWTSHNQQATVTAIGNSIGRAMASGFTAAIPGGAAGGGGLGPQSLRQIEQYWTAAGGPGGFIAHVAAAITGAESGFNPSAVQKGQPYATTGWGLWQITPGNSEPQAGIDYQLLNPYRNAIAAVAKYRQAGNYFSPWTTFNDGAYLSFMDHGGWLRPGTNIVYNGTGRPEQVLPPSAHGGGTTTVIVKVDPAVAASTPDRKLGQHIAQHITAAIKSGLALYPAGVTPR